MVTKVTVNSGLMSLGDRPSDQVEGEGDEDSCLGASSLPDQDEDLGAHPVQHPCALQGEAGEAARQVSAKMHRSVINLFDLMLSQESHDNDHHHQPPFSPPKSKKRRKTDALGYSSRKHPTYYDGKEEVYVEESECDYDDDDNGGGKRGYK